jgi:hypothetical protein
MDASCTVRRLYGRLLVSVTLRFSTFGVGDAGVGDAADADVGDAGWDASTRADVSADSGGGANSPIPRPPLQHMSASTPIASETFPHGGRPFNQGPMPDVQPGVPDICAELLPEAVM